MTVSEKINAFIEAEGKGNVRDALNVALTRIELLQIEKAGLIEMLDTSEPIGSVADKIISGISAPHDQHTPTPWTASENDWYIVAKSGHICEMIGPHGYETQRANARRIVAAVNATQAMPIAILEKIGGIFYVEETLQENFKKLESQNALLRKALMAACAELTKAFEEIAGLTQNDIEDAPQIATDNIDGPDNAAIVLPGWEKMEIRTGLLNKAWRLREIENFLECEGIMEKFEEWYLDKQYELAAKHDPTL